MPRFAVILLALSLLFSPFAVFAEEDLATTTPEVVATTEAVETTSDPISDFATTTEIIEATSTPISELATTTEITESTSTLNVTEATTTEISFPVFVPIYIFGDGSGGFLGITPISEDAYFWLYVADFEKFETSSTTATSASFENASSTSSENVQWTPLGTLVLSWDVTVGLSSGIPESERGDGHVVGVNYSYDNAGNLLSYGAAVNTWNYRNRLTDTNNAGTTTHYLYDYNDQRVQQDVKIGAGATSTTRYWSKIFETKGSTTTLYVFLPNGELLATVEGNGSATSTYIAHTDHQGGTNVMSDKNGLLAQLATYYPYGTKRNNELRASGFNEKRQFIGQYYDDAIALSYLNARYYDGGRGQFLSQDPLFTGDPNRQRLVNPQELNSYSYAANNPIRWSDPLGLWVNSGNGSFTAEKGDTLSKLQVQTGRNWHDTGFSRDPRTLQIGEKVSFAPVVKTSSSPTINNTTQAVAQYYGGKGENVNLGSGIQSALQNSSEQKMHQENIVTGKTSSDVGSYGVNLTKEYFFVGNTPVDYSTTRGTKFGVTTFTGFTRDGFWDPITSRGGDGMGPKREYPGGTPYQFNPYTWVVSYPNPQ